MGKTNRTCYTCGKEYYYCFSCPDDARPTWSYMFCCEDCKDIFTALSEYNNGRLEAKEAYSLVKDKIGNNINSYSEGIQKLYKKLVAENTVKQPVVLEKKPNNNYSQYNKKKKNTQ